MWKGFSFAAQAHVVKKVGWSCRFGATVGRAREMVILNPREADEDKKTRLMLRPRSTHHESGGQSNALFVSSRLIHLRIPTWSAFHPPPSLMLNLMLRPSDSGLLVKWLIYSVGLFNPPPSSQL